MRFLLRFCWFCKPIFIFYKDHTHVTIENWRTLHLNVSLGFFQDMPDVAFWENAFLFIQGLWRKMITKCLFQLSVKIYLWLMSSSDRFFLLKSCNKNCWYLFFSHTSIVLPNPEYKKTYICISCIMRIKPFLAPRSIDDLLQATHR